MTLAHRRLRPRFSGQLEKVEPPIVAGRVPPHDLDAEAAVLSAVMLDRTALDRVLEVLKPEHFYSDANGRIFEAALELSKASTPIDTISVASYLRDRELLAQVGGASYLTQIVDATPAVAHVGAHAKVVYEKWRVRSLISTCQRVAAEGYGDYGEAQSFIDGAEQAVYELARTTKKSRVQHIKVALGETFRQIQDAAARGDKTTGMSTGFERIDALTTGLHPGEFIIVAARPGMGKSAYVMNIATNLAAPRGEGDDQRPGFGVAVFSLEMPREQLAARAVCSEGRVELARVREARLQPDDWRKLTDAAAWLASIPLWIDDTPAISLLELRAKVRRIQAEYDREAVPADPARGIKAKPEQKVGVVVVDYIQLMKGREGVASREQEISEISRGLKELAKELGVAVIGLSQLNRAVETRSTKDKRPQMSDLRESGSLEQDADMIMFIYRDEYYNPETTDQKGIADIIIAKQRNGPPGVTVKLRFTGSCTRFDNLAGGEYPDNDT